MDEVVEAMEKYQGLVPLVYDIETMSLDEARPEDMQTAVYLKREADKVIAHHKYKRCLGIAAVCFEKSYSTTLVKYDKESGYRLNFYDWWGKRWLKLAEIFKEAK